MMEGSRSPGGGKAGSVGNKKDIGEEGGVSDMDYDGISIVSCTESESRTPIKRFYACSGSDTETGEGASCGKRSRQVAKRGGGRVGSSVMRNAYKTDKEREEDREFRDALDKRFLQESKAKDRAALSTSVPLAVEDVEVERLGAEELMVAAEERLNRILDITGKSTNLKGGYSNKIRRAAGTIREILEALVVRTEAEETRRLRADNNRLTRELANLREEVRAHRREFAELKRDAAEKAAAAAELAAIPDSARAEGPITTDQLLQLEKNIAQLVGNLVDSRLAGLEARLPPAPRMRPPLKSDTSKAGKEAREALVERAAAYAAARSKRTESVKTSGLPAATVLSSSSDDEFPALGAPRRKAPIKKKAANKEVAWTAFGPSTSKKVGPSVARPAPTAQKSGQKTVAPPAADGWTEVVRRKATSKKTAAPAPSVQAPSKEKGQVKPKIVLPGSTAVILKIRPEAAERGATYSSALLKAEREVDLTELGIGPLRIRQSATGARLIEIPGSGSHEKADALASRLKVVLAEEVEVTRPIKCADFRITGLDDAATNERVKAAVAREGGCIAEQVWVGDIRPDFRGARSALMSCPAAAGKKLLALGTIAVGWSRVRLQLLEGRPRHCFKCLGKGHTASMCPSSTDRSRLCYRCGQEGHIAAGCTAAPRCAVCADAGKPAGHVMGGRQCNPPTTRGRPLPSAAQRGGAGPNASDVEMSQ